MEGQTTIIEESDLVSKEFIETIPITFVGRSYILIVFILVGLLFFSLVINYPVIVHGDAKITTLVPPESIVSRMGGTIEKLLVQNGEVISANQTLLVLRSNASFEDVGLAKQILNRLRFRESEQLVGLHFNHDQESFRALNTLRLGSLRNQLDILQNDFFLYMNSQKVDIQKAKLNKLNNRQKERNANVDVLENTNNQMLLELSLAEQNEQRYAQLFNKGIVSAIDYERTKKVTLLAKQKLNDNIVAISNSQLQSSVLLTDRAVAGLNYHLEDKSKRSAFYRSIDDFIAAIKVWEDNHLVKAKSEGRVHFLDRLSDHSIILANKEIFIIENINENRQLIAEIELPPTNYGSISLGQVVELDLDNYDQRQFGFLKGKVFEMSSVLNEDSNYVVLASFDNALNTTTNKKITYREGMMGSCRILTKNTNLMNRLIQRL